MKKGVKRAVVLTIAIVVCIGILAGVSAFMISSYFSSAKDGEVSQEGSVFDPKKIAEEHENINYDSDSGNLYVANEVIVFATNTADESDITELAEDVGAEVDANMADVGIYRFIFKEKMNLEQIDKRIKKIKGSRYVEECTVNSVIEQNEDAEEVTVETKKPIYPEDEWDGDAWNMDVPRGANWGMEAIRAPGAWAYLDEMSDVRIGLIDTNVYENHPDLDFTKSTRLFYDEETGKISWNEHTANPEDHGTHVAGIMNAKWNKTGVCGVMDGHASLYHLTVYFQKDGRFWNDYGTSYTYLAALKNLIDDDVQAINISLNTSRLISFAASRGNEKAITHLKSQAVAVGQGLKKIIESRQENEQPDFVICVAAGNANNLRFVKDDNASYGYREALENEEGDRGDVEAKYNNFLNLIDEESVRNRIIVVGAAGIDKQRSTSAATFYEYAYFSDIGDRVDIVAPGCDIYSTYYSAKDSSLIYEYLSGTSMATPHVTGVAGMLFAANPSLSGVEIKQIIGVTASNRFYYTGGNSGLLNAEEAVKSALATRTNSVRKVLKTGSQGLDVCFVVDTTGSMGDDIENARENMKDILGQLEEKTKDYRVAIADYRDFGSRTGNSDDYPSSVKLSFSSDTDDILDAINSLDLGYGGDDLETVYSGLVEAISLDWRSNAKKVVVLLGDAGPLDPEPNTDYTYDDVIKALNNAQILFDSKHSDERVLGGKVADSINVYSIGIDTDGDTRDFFADIAEDTGGMFSDISNADEVSGAIIDSIEQIELIPVGAVTVNFDDAYAGETIDLYSDGKYMFSFTLNSSADFDLDNMELKEYEWKCADLYSTGSFTIDGEKTSVDAETNSYWVTSLQKVWATSKWVFLIVCIGIMALSIGSVVALRNVKNKKRKIE